MKRKLTLVIGSNLLLCLSMAQNKIISISTGVTQNFSNVIYSQSGVQLPIEAKGRAFPYLGLAYASHKKNETINEFELFTQFAGHKLKLSEKEFPSTKLFSYKAYTFSVGFVYKREWPILKNFLNPLKTKPNALFAGATISFSQNVDKKFNYGNDEVVSLSNKKIIALGKQEQRFTFSKRNMNLGALIKYRFYADGKEAFSISGEVSTSIGSTYTAHYGYTNNGIYDVFTVKNRASMYTFSVGMPLFKMYKKRGIK